MNVLVNHDVNVRNIVVWPFTNSKTEQCGKAYAFGERAKSASWSLNANTQFVNSDGVTVGSYTGIPNGQGTLGLAELTPGERSMLLGNTAGGVILKNSVINITNVGNRDIAPYVRLAFITDTDSEEGLINLYKFLRCKFSPYEKTVDQVNESGQATFSTISVPFTFFNTFSTNENLTGKIYEAKGVNPNTEEGAAFIENWFTVGDFVGTGGLYNTNSAITVNSLPVLDGGTINSGSTVTFSGSASGGTAPYKYSYYLKAQGSDSWTAVAEDSSDTTATREVTVVSDTVYYFKIVAKDANGVTATKTITATVVV